MERCSDGGSCSSSNAVASVCVRTSAVLSLRFDKREERRGRKEKGPIDLQTGPSSCSRSLSLHRALPLGRQHRCCCRRRCSTFAAKRAHLRLSDCRAALLLLLLMPLLLPCATAAAAACLCVNAMQQQHQQPLLPCISSVEAEGAAATPCVPPPSPHPCTPASHLPEKRQVKERSRKQSSSGSERERAKEEEEKRGHAKERE